MTRINLVNPKVLSNKHLFAEWRELPRIFTLVINRVAKGHTNPKSMGIPTEFKLGSGHMLFFFDKLEYLASRHKRLTVELKLRRYRITEHEPLSSLKSVIPNQFWGNFKPSRKDTLVSFGRLLERDEGHYKQFIKAKEGTHE